MSPSRSGPRTGSGSSQLRGGSTRRTCSGSRSGEGSGRRRRRMRAWGRVSRWLLVEAGRFRSLKFFRLSSHAIDLLPRHLLVVLTLCTSSRLSVVTTMLRPSLVSICPIPSLSLARSYLLLAIFPVVARHDRPCPFASVPRRPNSASLPLARPTKLSRTSPPPLKRFHQKPNARKLTCRKLASKLLPSPVLLSPSTFTPTSASTPLEPAQLSTMAPKKCTSQL